MQVEIDFIDTYCNLPTLQQGIIPRIMYIIYIYICIHTHTHTHTHIYIYICHKHMQVESDFIDTYCNLPTLFSKASFRETPLLSTFVSTRKVGGSMVFPASFRGCLTVVNNVTDFVVEQILPDIDSETDIPAYTTSYNEPDTDPEQRILDMLSDDLVLGAIFGLAPIHAPKWSEALEARLYAYLAHTKAVAVGGCGLEFGLAQGHEGYAVMRDAQIACLKRHIEIACKVCV